MNSEQVSAASFEPSLAPRCIVCGVALDGLLSYLFRVAGISRSSRNPNLCNRCNTHAEEGRIVELSVLFADLSAFTELTHKLGPEHTCQVIDAFLQMATCAVAKYDGLVDKYIGDAIMALFNVPIRRDDHPARAVAAALEIQAGMPQLQEQFGLDLKAGVGIAAGWARVGRLGSTDKKDYTAVGDVVNLAARLEGQARPGEVLVHGPVYGKVAVAFPDVCSERLSLKGFQEPVQAYRLCSADGPLPRAYAGEPEREPAVRLGLGIVLFAILGAPCAASVLIGPLAVILGIGTLFGAVSVYWGALDAPLFRLPLLTLATLGSLANLYTVWHARTIRRQSQAGGDGLPMTQLERRRTVLVAGLACVTLLVVALESYVHVSMHHTWL